MHASTFKLFGLGAALVILAAAVFVLVSMDNGQEGLAQAGKPITVCASGCDFSKIQQAIDAAPAGATIMVQTGSYKENLTIRDKDGLTLKGAGPDHVILDGNAPQQKDITPGILILNSRNITVSGFKITNSRRGLEADDTTLLLIESNNFEKNLRQGIDLVRSEAQVVGNMVQGTQPDLDGSRGQGIGISGSQVVISDTTVTENMDCGIRMFFQAERTNEVTGSGNTVAGNRGGDLCGNLSIMLLAQPPAEGTLAQVTVPTDVPTIQEAVNKVQSGGAIMVAAGTYQQPVQSGPVQIYKSLRIIGAGPEQTVLQAPGPEWVAINIATDQIQVTIEGVKVTGARRGMQIATGAGGSVTLRNVKVDGNGAGKAYDGGLWIFGQGTVTLDQVSVSGNKSSGVFGLEIMEQAKVTIQNSTIANNNALGGIALSSSSQATIWQSTIADNSGFGGIDLFNSASATIDGNTIAHNVEEGIFVGDSARAQVTNNQITATKGNPQAQGCCGFGINLRNNAQATIEGNTISSNASSGIILQEDSQATILRNTISDNLHEGVTVTGRTRATFDDDTITGNRDFGIDSGDSAQVSIQNSTIERNVNGVIIRKRAALTISGSTISQNVQRGVWATDQATLLIDNSTISQNRRYGAIWAEGHATLTIKNSAISGHRNPSGEQNRVIFLLNFVKATITGNTMKDNDDWGVMVGNQARATIQENTISNNGAGVLVGFNVPDETPSAEISLNNIVNNRSCGAYVETGAGITLTGQRNTIANNAGGNLCGDLSKYPAGFGGGK